MGTFQERLDSRNNALNLLRLVLAALVIVSHASPIGGFGEELRIGGLTLGNFAVGGFFAISGYLITASRFHSDFFSFAWRRVLRIFPGYWACLAVVGLVFGAVAGAVRGGWTLQSGITYFLSNGLMVFKGDSLAQTLKGAPFFWSWNGSLWTLRYELLCYVAVGIVFLLPQLRVRPAFLILCFAGSTALSVLVDLFNIVGMPGDIGFLLPFFVAGACLVRYSHVVPATGTLAAAAAVSLLALTLSGYGKSLIAMPLAYICLWLAISLPRAFRRLGRRNDLSYGLYLYGFPVQQMLVLAGAHHFGLLWFTLLSLLAAFPMAIASWFLIERPSMRLKGLVENRRTRSVL